MNEELNKFTRWIVPGGLFVSMTTIFTLLDYIISEPKVIKIVFDQISQNGTSSEAVLIGVALLTSMLLPIGFLIYQAYFYARWHSPFSRTGLFFVGHGRDNDIQFLLSNSGIFNKLENCTHNENNDQNNSEFVWHKNWATNPLMMLDHRYKWAYIELNFYDKIASLKRGSDIGHLWHSRHKYLHEIVHTLGASSVALILGFFSYIILKILWERSLRGMILAGEQKYTQGDIYVVIYYTVFPTLLFIALSLLLKHERIHFLKLINESDSVKREKIKNTICAHYGLSIEGNKHICDQKIPILYSRLSSIVTPYPAYIFLFLITTIFLLISVSILSVSSVIKWGLHLLIALLMIAPLLTGYTGISKRVTYSNVIVFAIMLIVALFPIVHIDLGSYIDFGVTLNLLLFLWLHLFTSSNREGARFDMLALESFILSKTYDEIQGGEK